MKKERNVIKMEGPSRSKIFRQTIKEKSKQKQEETKKRMIIGDKPYTNIKEVKNEGEISR